jgi:hypothetical protein
MATAKKVTAKKAAAKHTPRGLEQDRRLVSSQPYELAYAAKKAGATKGIIEAAKVKVGPSRKSIEAAVKKAK